ncbi:hypothetical protein L6164_003395 [Bauhinia variegata]|uniref:Uncharacterized protein n=1 Tax=Bauhinia variegata TaxID=167791 RepID=A0ACB9Q1C7_BAUVA|nr:hypothetical protein L6164_003395 [Bauhinia variegata]
MAEEKQTAKPYQQEKTIEGIFANLMKEWPELKGAKVDDAKRKIKEEKPEVEIQVVPPNYRYGCILDFDRVCLFVDDSGIVTEAPFTR